MPEGPLTRREWGWLCGGFLLVLLLYQLHLGAPDLWGDEADTGNFARAVLRSGLPRALGGDNALVYGDCVQLGGAFLSRRLPWVQYYVGAASLALFGDSAAGLRRLFALIAALALFPLALLLRRRTAAAPWLAPLLLLQPQALCFARQARYFPLVVCLGLAQCWLLLAEPGGRRLRLLLSLLCAVLLFHSHPLAALGISGALAAYALGWQRRALVPALAALAVGLGSFLLWYGLLPALPTRMPGHLDALGKASYFRKSALALWAQLRDLDYVGALPLWPLLLGGAAFAWRRRPLAAGQAPLGGLILLLLLAQAVLAALLVGYEGSARYAPLRYGAHLIVLLPAGLYLLLERVLPPRLCAPVLLLCLVLTPLSLGFWWRDGARRPLPLSFWAPVYAELLGAGGEPADWAPVRAELEPGQGLLEVLPEGNNEVFEYYLGRRYRLVPDVFGGSACEAALQRALGPAAWARVKARPDVVVHFDRPPRQPGYQVKAVPFPRGQPDGGRPELTRRRFLGEPDALAPVLIFRSAPAAAP